MDITEVNDKYRQFTAFVGTLTDSAVYLTLLKATPLEAFLSKLPATSVVKITASVARLAGAATV